MAEIGITLPGQNIIYQNTGQAYQTDLYPYLFDYQPCPLCPKFCSEKPDEEVEKEKKQREDPEKRYEKLVKEMKTMKITAETLIESAKTLKATRPTVGIYNEAGEMIFFKGDVRGTEKYAEKTKGRFEICVEELEKIDGTPLFVTVTVDPSKFSGDCLAMRKALQAEKAKFIRKMKRLGTLHYVEVVESHLSGQPHAHFLLILEGKQHKYWIDSKGKRRMSDNNLRKRIKNCWKAGNSDIEVAYKGGLVGYMTKYMRKGIDGVLDSLEGGQETLTDEQKKALMDTLLPIVAQTRSWSASKELRMRAKDTRDERFRQIGEARRAGLPGKTEYEKDLNALFLFLNNSTAKCAKTVVLLFKNQEKWGKLYENGTILKQNDPLIDDVFDDGRVLGCNNCKFVRIMRYYFEKYGLSGEKVVEPPEFWEKFVADKDRLIDQAIAI